MYTEESVNEVKAAANIIEVVGDSIEIKKHGINYVALCPLHKEKGPSFIIYPKSNRYKCFGCAKSGDSVQFLIEHENKSYPEALQTLSARYNIPLVNEKDHVYIKPVWKNNTDLHSVFVKRFEERGINQGTIKKLQITSSKEWMPQREKEVNVINYNYFRNEELTNIKYRDINKNFKLHKGAELILYNLDSLKDKKEAYITEGEDDCASLIEAGYWNDTSGVVSVPNGATKDKNNLSYIENCIKEIEHIERWHIAVDDDINGRKLREELADRFGKERCDFIGWKGKKDANDVLKEEGIQGVIDCCSKPNPFPIEGAFTISDISLDIDDMYVNGLEKGIDLKIPDFALNIVKGYLTVITGMPSSGKSQYLDYMILNSLRFHNWSTAYYSPENRPTQLHFSKLCRMLIGKHWEGSNRITMEEKMMVKNYLEKKLWFVKPEKDFTLTSILTHIKRLILMYGIDSFVIDAWNKLEHKETGTEYVGRSLDELTAFCEINKVHGFLVAHPTKIEKDRKTGEYQVPTLYNISGSANFYNKADNGISVYRDFKTNETKIFRQKIKFDHWGDFGHSAYKFHVPSLRYYKEGFPDFRNWITGELNTTAVKEEKVPQQMDVFYDVEDAPF